MRISTKGRYALRLMLDIAMNDAEGKPVRVRILPNGRKCLGSIWNRLFRC